MRSEEERQKKFEEMIHLADGMYEICEGQCSAF